MPKSQMVESPAGERIQITSDQDWADATGVSLNSLKQWNGSDGLPGMKPMTFRALWEHGEFSNPSGRTSAEIMQWLETHFPGANLPGQQNVVSQFSRPHNMPAVIMKTKGKRTYSIKLVALPERWYQHLLQDISLFPSRNGDRPQEPVDADRDAAETVANLVMPEGLTDADMTTTMLADTEGQWSDADWAALQLDAPTVYEQPPPLELHVANQVALSLLTTVVEIISSGSADTSQLSSAQRLTMDLEQSQHLLSQRLMENDKLRRQLREAGDHINALKSERDGLRSRLRMTEHNLTEVLKGETAQAVQAEINKRVSEVMRQAPQPKGDD